MKVGRWTVGLLLLVAVAVIWAAASVLVQYIFENLNYDQPLVLTYICNSLFAIYIPGWLGMSCFGWVENPPLRGHALGQGERSFCGQRHDISGMDLLPGSESDGEDEEGSPPKLPKTGRWSHLSTAKVSAMICPIWFLANWTYNQSLSMTSVTSSTIIATTSSLFTYVLSIVTGNEVFTMTKLAGVVLCIAGAVMVALNDSEEADDGEKSSFWGDVVCLISAIFYSMYTVLIRSTVPDEKTVVMPLLFGYLGVLNCLGILPILLVVYSFDPGIFSGLSTEVVGLVIVKGLADNVLSDYLWALAVLYTSPTVATVGLSLTIPLAFASDALWNAKPCSILSTLGASLVVVGFAGVNIGDQSFEARCLKQLGYAGHPPESGSINPNSRLPSY